MLWTGVQVQVPIVVYGTAWKKNRTEELATAALMRGYIGIDTANQPKHYNEAGVGAALASVFASGRVSRDQLFLQTKFTPLAGQLDDETLPYDRNAPLADQVAQSVQASLRHLRTDYIDSYVLHEQMADQDEMLVVWQAMEAQYDAGTVKLLGISNVNADRLTWLLGRCRVKPTFVQNRCRGLDEWDSAVREICTAHGLVYQGFWLISGNRELLRHPDVVTSAHWHGRTPGQLVFR
jgi:diketogulonate reductase-like aldo/keto reductase